MLLGVQSGGLFEALGEYESLKLMNETGFNALDYNVNNELPGIDIRNGITESILYQKEEEIYQHFSALKSHSEHFEIEIHQIHAPFPTRVDDLKAQESLMTALENTIKVAAFLDCDKVVVHPQYFQYVDDVSQEEEWEMNRVFFSHFIPILKKHHVSFCLENMFTKFRGKIISSVCADAKEACFYIDQLNELAGEKCFSFCLDTGHVNLCSNDIRETIITLGDRIEALHIHDNDGIDDQHVMPYTGIIDWDRFCEGLALVNYQGVLCFETFNSLRKFPQELWRDCLQTISNTGKYFADRINSRRTIESL